MGGAPVVTNMDFSAFLLGWGTWSQKSVTLKKTNKDHFLHPTSISDAHAIFGPVKDMTLLIITACGQLVMAAARDLLGSLTRCSTGWENHTENALWHPKGGSGKARGKLKDQRRAALRAHQTAIILQENETVSHCGH